MPVKKIAIPMSELGKFLGKDLPGLKGCDDDEVFPNGIISVLDNHVFFYADVTPGTILKLTNILVKIRNEHISESAPKGKEPEEIHLHINSPGGSATAGFMAYDNLTALTSTIPVWTYIEGEVCSAATLISIAGTKRFITPTSFMLIHEMRSFLAGTMSAISEEYQNLLKFENKYLDIYLKHSNFQNKEELKEFLKRDSVFTAEEALERGLVDEIATKVY